ncbi:MAG: polyprenyl synthetase family protein, partial [Solirubrobacteraceae bacterium]
MTATQASSDAVIAQLDATDDIAKLRERITAWLAQVDPELRDSLTWAFSGTPKHFRPLTLFACDRAVHATPSADAVELAFAVELMHNMSLIVDDVLDVSEERRGIATVAHRFGQLPALMASGYLVADSFDAFAGDAFAVRHLSELLRRLGAAECLQWRLRRQPLGVADWQR